MQKNKNIAIVGWIMGLIMVFSFNMTAQENTESFRFKAPQAGDAREIKIGNYDQFSLDNGMKIILVQNNKLPRVSYRLSLVNNPVLEGDKAGYVSITGDLLGRGTSTRTKAELDEAVDFVGASFGTSAYGVSGSSLTKHQDALLDVITDVLYNPSFPEEELQKIVTQAMSGLAQAKEDPQTIANNVSGILNYSKGHPYGEVETEETIKNVSIDDCKAYYNKFFRPDNAILTIVGDIDRKHAEKIAYKYFAKWEKPADVLVDEPLVKVEMPTSTEVAFAQKDGAVQSLIQIGYPVELKRGSADAIKVSVMNTILGGGSFMGRLMQNLREDKAYTYGARSSIGPDEHIASFTAFASVRNEVTDSAIVQFLYEMEKMATEEVSEDDLRMAKSSLSGGFARSMESPQTIARFAYNTIRYNYPKDYYSTYLQKLEAVTIEDVKNMAAKYILPEKAHIIVVGEKEDVAEKLLVFDNSGEVNFYDAFGNKVEMKSADAPTDITAESVVKNYIKAVGGKENMKNVSSIKMVAGLNVMGQEFEMTMIQKEGKFYQKMGNESMTVQEQVYDGEKAKMSGMGGSQMVTEGEELEAIKKQATLFPSLNYLTDEYTLELKGVEMVDGKDAYKVVTTDKEGNKESLFFDKESSFMVKKVETQDNPQAPGQTVTVATKLSEFKEFGGIYFPTKMGIVGGAPFPINLEFKTVEVNGEVDDSVFVIK